MRPVKSNNISAGCAPTSSNCVVWQGPDLKCIDLCTGDSISEINYKLAEQICCIKDELDLSDMDLKCIVDACASCHDPKRTLKIILQLVIDKVCELEDAINNIETGNTSNVTVRMADCFWYESDGDLIKDLEHSLYTKKIGQKVCDLADSITSYQDQIDDLQSQIDSLDNRLDNLEAGGSTQVTPSCVSSSSSLNIDTAWELLETEFCSLQNATGTPSELLDVIDNECQGVDGGSIVKKLSDSSSALWSGNSSTVAETLSKMWLAICDLRAAVSIIQDTCCNASCDDIVIAFDAKVDSTDGAGVRLYFGSKSKVPSTFTDCDSTLGNKLIITDGSGNSYTTYIKLRDDVFNDSTALADGFYIDLTYSPLDFSTGLTFTMDACMTNGSLSCVKCISAYMNPSNVCDFCEISVSGSADSSVTVIYSYQGSSLS